MALLLKGSASGRALLLGVGLAAGIGSSNGTLSITTLAPTEAVAPAPFWFTASGISGFAAQDGPSGAETYDPSFHEITFIWTVTRPGGAASTWQPTTGLNMPTVWNNRNLAYGKKAHFVFDEPGTYTIDLWAVDVNGTTGSAQTTIEIADPDTYYSGNRTILYDPTGTGDNATFPGSQVDTAWSAAVAAAVALAPTTCRILIKRGETLTEMLENGSDIPTVRIGAWGAGAKPIIGPLTNGSPIVRPKSDGTVTNEVVVYDLDFRGGWDSTTETGYENEVFNRFWDGDETVPDFAACFHNCDVSGMIGFGAVSGTPAMPVYTSISECRITNWRDYGIFVDDLPNDGGHRYAVIGCSIDQDPDALSGGAKNGLYNTHGCLRFERLKSTIVAGCYFFTVAGWSGGTSEASSGTAVPTINPAFRPNQTAIKGADYIVDRLAVEGIIYSARQNSGFTSEPVNFVADRVIQIINSGVFNDAFVNEYGGTTIRNYLGVFTNTLNYYSAEPWRAIGFSPGSPTSADNLAAPIRAYNCTILDLRSDANANGSPVVAFNVNGSFTDAATENNILHGPNRSTPTVGDAPIDVATAVGVTPRFKGFRFNFYHEDGTFGSDITNGNSFAIPYADIGDALYNLDGLRGSATNQAYWNAISGTDTKHSIYVNGTGYHAELSQISVSFGATEVTITNNSGVTWSSGQEWVLRLDRKSLIPARLTTFASEGQTIPDGQPTTGSAAIADATTGRVAYDDLFLVVRGASKERGALEA